MIPPARRGPCVLRSGRWLLALLAAVAVASACRSEVGDAIDRETFIDTFVDLRSTALKNPGTRITPEQRTEILAKHGVSEEDLLHFADVHGRDVDYMADVWSEVETRLQPAETTPSPSP
jgi:hypothetical protein